MKKLKLLVMMINLSLCVLLSGCSVLPPLVAERKEDYVTHTSQEGTAITIMEDINVECQQLTEDNQLVSQKIQIEKYRVVRIGMVWKPDPNIIYVTKEFKCQAQVPDENNKLQLVNINIPTKTVMKIGNKSVSITSDGEAKVLPVAPSNSDLNKKKD